MRRQWVKGVKVGVFRRGLIFGESYPVFSFLFALIAIFLTMTDLTGTSRAAENAPLGPSHFSATMLSTFNGRTTRSRIYLAGKNVRIEPEMSGSAMSGMYELLTGEEKTIYMVMPAQHMCMKQGIPPQNEAQMMSLLKKTSKETTIRIVGHEKLDGHPTIVREIIYHPQNRPATKIRIWNALDLKNVPLKEVIDTGNGTPGTILYRDISLAKPGYALFVPPAHCGGVPGMGLGGMVPHLPAGNQFHLP
ncbi:MAG: DUF4412 domain-containing protein [Leptospirales bacterium]